MHMHLAQALAVRDAFPSAKLEDSKAHCIKHEKAGRSLGMGLLKLRELLHVWLESQLRLLRLINQEVGMVTELFHQQYSHLANNVVWST